MTLNEYGRVLGAFQRTACYKGLTSRILAAANCNNYYGPDEGEFKGSCNYRSKRKCNKERCNMKECDRIREELYVACKKSQCYITDKATTWFNKQKNVNSSKIIPDGKLCNDNLKFQSPPCHCLVLQPSIRDICNVQPVQTATTTRISPEFRHLLQQHDERLRRLYILNCMPTECKRKYLEATTQKYI